MMKTFISSYWTKLANRYSLPNVVNPSIPILWFGDMKAYEESELKIMTVGLNPSCWEFKDNKNAPYDITLRFPKATQLWNYQTLTAKDVSAYSDAMNDYFKHRPYSKWFKHNERVLNELCASYNVQAPYKLISENKNDILKHTAIHVDIYAPLATDPVWGGMKKRERSVLCSACSGMFDDLMNILNPDIIIIAVNQTEIAKHFVNAKGNKCTRHNADFDSTNSSHDYLRGFFLYNGKKLIWGTNSNGQPFSSVKDLSLRMTSLKQQLNIL